MLKGTAREAAAEFLGTFILIVFGVGSVAQAVLSHAGDHAKLSINLAWGLAVTMGVYVAGGISGAHLNPAVTLALAVYRRFSWKKVPVFVGAQFLGAFLAWMLSKARPQIDEKYTVPVASGLIAGESLMGVAIKLVVAGPQLVKALFGSSAS